MAIKQDKWLGNKGKENLIRAGISEIVGDDEVVDKIFSIVKEHGELYDK